MTMPDGFGPSMDLRGSRKGEAVVCNASGYVFCVPPDMRRNMDSG